MKKIISILLFACAGALAACDFLDVVPEGQATQEDIFKTSKEARKYLNTLYTYAPNIAAYRYMPDFCAGDDIITATNGQTRYFPYKSMLYNEENASQTYYGLWDATTSSPSGRTNYDMYKGIRYCYIMIDNIDAVPGISPSVADEFKGEAYFLIAYYHWVLLTHYGPVILVRGQLDMGLPEEQVYVARSPFDECVTFIAETYDRAADLLHGYPTRPDADLGRATSVAAKAMKARLLLYAASPLCNGNTEFYARFRNNDGTPLMSQTYNPEKWKWALDACQEAITLAEDNGHRLYESPNATAAATAAERGEINYHDCFVEPLWNTTEYLWAMGDQTGIGHLQRYGGARLKLPYSTDGFCINIVPTFECVEITTRTTACRGTETPRPCISTPMPIMPKRRLSTFMSTRSRASMRRWATTAASTPSTARSSFSNAAPARCRAVCSTPRRSTRAVRATFSRSGFTASRPSTTTPSRGPTASTPILTSALRNST